MRKLKILSFNLGLLRVKVKDRKVFEFTPYLEERFEKIVEEFKKSDADIISIQEIYNKMDVIRFIEELKFKYPYYFAPRADYYLRFASGLVVLSKVPLKNSTFEKFKESTWDEKLYVDKGFIQTYVDFDDFLIQLVNAHTTAGGYFRHPENRAIDVIRETQIQQILNAKDPKTHLTLITGDLNCGPQTSSQNFELFKKNNFIDVFEFKDNGLYTWDIQNPLNKTSPHATSPSQRIDHILYKIHEKKEWHHEQSKIVYKDAKVKIKPSRNSEEIITLSDHYGVEANILN